MKNNKIVSLALVGVMAVSMALTACGSKYDDTSMDISKIDVDKYVGSVGDYSNLAVEAPVKTEITDQVVQDYINRVLGSMGNETIEVDRAAQNGDVVNIDFEGFRDGVAFEGGKSEAYDLELGSGSFIPGFEDGLIGCKTGDNVDLNLTFPENYQVSSLAGQDVVFKVVVNAVKESKVPELTEEMVPKFGIEGINTVDEFKTYIRGNLVQAAEETYTNGRRDAVLYALNTQTEFLTDNMPENLLNYYVTQVQTTDRQNATQYGISLEDYVSGYYTMTFEDYTAECRKKAVEMVKDALLCEKIARTENMVVTDSDIDAQMAIDAEKYGYETVDQFKQVMDGNEYKNYLIELKVIDKILETATVTEKELDTTAVAE